MKLPSMAVPLTDSRQAGLWLRGAAWLEASKRFVQFLFLYCAALMVFATFALGSAPLHHDMTEAWAWGKEFQLGYVKHPPMSAWLTGLWFTVFPRDDLAFYLLSTLNVAAALSGVWALAGLFLDWRGRLAAVLFLVLTPSFNLWALKFNANAPLLSAWPWTTYFFLRSLETRRTGFAIAAGVLGAIALLTKYYSLVLFATLLTAAVLHPERQKYFCSAAPYVTSAVGLLLIGPHLAWTVTSSFPTIEYAMSKMHYSVADARGSTIKTLLATPCLFGLPAVAYVTAFRARSWAGLKNGIIGTFTRSNAWLVCLALGPFILTLAAYLFANTRITTAFLIPAFFALPAIFLTLSRVVISDAILLRITYFVASIWLLLAIASPFLGFYALKREQAKLVEPRREVALAATSYWHTRFGTTLTIVTGEERLATAATFYSPDAPAYLNLVQPSSTPWVLPAQARRDGLLIICSAQSEPCLRQALSAAGADAPRFDFEATPHFLGFRAEQQAFVFIAQPPQKEFQQQLR